MKTNDAGYLNQVIDLLKKSKKEKQTISIKALN